MSPHPTYRFLISLSLITVLALALTASGAPIAAQQAPISVQPSSAVTTDTFHSSPVMFIENAGQWLEAARFQVWGAPAGTIWLAEDTTPANPAASSVEETPDGCMKLTSLNASDKAPQKDGYQMIQCPYLSSESIVGDLPSAIDDVPPAPVLISPDNQSRLDTLIPVLRVDTTISGVETSVRYEYSVNADLSPGAGGMGVAGPSTRREWSFPLGSGFAGYNLQPNTRYYWHARTGYGNWQGSVSWGPYSPTWSFTTGSDGTILPGPELVSPPNNSDVYTLRPILRWHTLPGARGFFVQASPVGGGPGYLWFSEELPSESVGFWTDLPLNSSWDWKVRLRNDYAWGDLSSVWRFTVRLAAISGRVTDANGIGIPGVTVWADSTRNTTTDANGNYTLTGLPAGTYNIRPEKAPYAFSPPSRTVTVPPNATGVDFQAVAITKIQVNQVLGNTTNYVAGKDTVVRVFLSGAVPFDPDHQQLQIYRNGNLITQTPLRPRSFTGRSDVLDFLCDRQECEGWQKGFYSFEARVNGDYLIQPSVEFQEGGDLRVLVVPVATGTGTIRFDWPSIAQYMKNVYPLAANEVKWKPSNLELSAYDLDLSQETDQGELLIRLEKQRRRLCRTRGSTCYDAIVGIIPEMKICNPTGCIPCDQPGGTTNCHCTKGWTAENIDEIKSAVVMEVEEMPTVGVHEIGHLLGLGDEYKGGLFKCDINPPPSSYVGRGGLQCTEPNIPEWAGACGASGSKVRGTGTDPDNPFEVGGRGALPDMLSFMGSGERQAKFWVTPTAYNHLFSKLSLAATRSTAAPQITERVIDVSGWIQMEDTATLDPVYHVEADAPPVVVGPYSIEVLDAQGGILASQGFNVSFTVLTEPPRDADEGPFVVTVRFPANATKLKVKHGATVLTEKIISAHAPTLSLVSPTAGQTWAATGNCTVRWQGSDLDLDTLYYTVLYRQGTGDWIVLGADLTTNELTVDAAGLPGGTAAQVQVLATDGINTTTAESGLFTVGRKGPEAFITYPAEGASFMPGVSFFLQGTAYDLEDGTLPDSAYHWTSDRDGDLGTGATNLVILSPGPHVITLTVRDSDGNTTVKTLRISAGSQQFMPLIYRSQ